VMGGQGPGHPGHIWRPRGCHGSAHHCGSCWTCRAQCSGECVRMWPQAAAGQLPYVPGSLYALDVDKWTEQPIETHKRYHAD
jgi:hypothetical protein